MFPLYQQYCVYVWPGINSRGNHKQDHLQNRTTNNCKKFGEMGLLNEKKKL